MKKMMFLFLISLVSHAKLSTENVIHILENPSELSLNLQSSCSLNDDNGNEVCKTNMESFLDTKECTTEKILNSQLNLSQSAFKERLSIISNNYEDLDSKIECTHKHFQLDEQTAINYKRRNASKSKMSELFSSINRTSSGTNRVAEQLYELKQQNSELDLSLALTVAFRESGGLIYSTSFDRVNSYSQGGLDFFGTNYEKIKKYLPAKYRTDFATNFREQMNEHGYTGKSVSIQKKDLIIAYGAYLEYIKNRYLKTYLNQYGFNYEDFKKLSPTAQRFWTVMTFAAPGGVEFKGDTGNRANVKSSSLGVKTLLTLAKKKIEKGEIKSLEDWNKLSEFDHYTRLQLAKYTVINATTTSDVLCL